MTSYNVNTAPMFLHILITTNSEFDALLVFATGEQRLHGKLGRSPSWHQMATDTSQTFIIFWGKDQP